MLLEALGAVLSLPFLALFVFSAYLLYQHSRYDHLPGPARDGFFSGHMPTVRRRRTREKIIIHQIWADLASQHMPLYVFWFFHRPVVMISDANLVKEVLIKQDLHKDPFGYNHFANLFGHRLLGGSLLSEVDHDKWKHQRALLNPAFHYKNLVAALGGFNSSCDIYLKKLATLAEDNKEVSMADELVRLALDVVGKVAYDLDVNSINAPDAPIPANTRTVLEGLVQSFRKPFIRFQPSTYDFQRKCIESVEFLRGAARGVIEARLKAMAAEEDTHDDILTHIVKIGQHSPDTTMEDLIDHFITFIVGGQETTSNHMAFALLGILLHPEIERRIVAEVDEVLGSRQHVTQEDLNKMKYLDQCMKEALRLHPPQPAVTRTTKKETKLGNYVIPAGTSVMCDVHVLHHHPKYWDDPEKFDPERFNDENKLKVEHYAYFPFSLGPHNCIGTQFAQLETKLVLARTFQTFKMTLVPGQELKAVEQMTTRPKDGVRVHLELR
ncbi:cholesterol 24-hydroxylase [Nematostella vectensis]|uniref:cholesterol 24-hydroxylase n=1 Tax=Nematostella vectensis TaxID=45351 RepID=UPI00207776D9|nr:cholesterol 24-hydroxylase [Nematostella vectensis]XP_048588148.1 cholesterol 24-hydroxylase [Nematostella vectensis]XP_048588149.1 cholesterol 24-hydroxylase [Nematostella vectensis]XP_048588150.1 cholesterol 24-hydroxylase [Nematostella vectensis]